MTCSSLVGLPRWRSVLAASAGLAVSATSVLAVPAVMDRVPPTSIATIAIPNFATFKKDLESLGTLLQVPVAEGLDQFGLLRDGKGLKPDGSVAVVIFPPAKAGGGEGAEAVEGEPRAVVIVPVTNYADFLGNFNAQPGGGVDAIEIEGEPAHAKDLGDGFAALAKTTDELALLDGSKGHLGKHKELAGAAASAQAERSDLAVIVNMPVARPLIEKAVMEGMEDLGDQAGMGPGGQDPAAAAEAASPFIKDLTASTRGMVMTLNIDNLGVALDMTGAFTEGSRWAKIASGAGNATKLLGRVPAMPFLFAGALDLSNAEIVKLLSEFNAASSSVLPERERKLNEASMAAFQKMTGAASVLGVSPAGLMGGLLSNGVSFMATTDNAALSQAQQSAMTAMVDAKMAQGKFEPAKQEVDGVKVDSFEFRMLPDPNNPAMAMGAGMIFGPSGGPSGFMAGVDGGVIQTLGRNSATMSAALKAAKGENSFTGDAVIGQIGEKLPKDRVAEAYIGIKDLLNQMLPMAAMMGMPVTIDIPQNLPPIGAAIAPSAGSMTASIYLPAPVLKTFGEVVKQVQAGMPEGEQPGDNQPAGQPQF
jgi:hypothetical protein